MVTARGAGEYVCMCFPTRGFLREPFGNTAHRFVAVAVHVHSLSVS